MSTIDPLPPQRDDVHAPDADDEHIYDPHEPRTSLFPPPLALRSASILDALSCATLHSLSSLSGYTFDLAVASLIAQYSRTLPASLVLQFFIIDQWIPHVHTTPSPTLMLPFLSYLRQTAHREHNKPPTSIDLCTNLECLALPLQPPPPHPPLTDDSDVLSYASTELVRRFATGMGKFGPKWFRFHGMVEGERITVDGAVGEGGVRGPWYVYGSVRRGTGGGGGRGGGVAGRWGVGLTRWVREEGMKRWLVGTMGRLRRGMGVGRGRDRVRAEAAGAAGHGGAGAGGAAGGAALREGQGVGGRGVAHGEEAGSDGAGGGRRRWRGMGGGRWRRGGRRTGWRCRGGRRRGGPYCETGGRRRRRGTRERRTRMMENGRTKMRRRRWKEWERCSRRGHDTTPVYQSCCIGYDHPLEGEACRKDEALIAHWHIAVTGVIHLHCHPNPICTRHSPSQHTAHPIPYSPCQAAGATVVRTRAAAQPPAR